MEPVLGARSRTEKHLSRFSSTSGMWKQVYPTASLPSLLACWISSLLLFSSSFSK